MIQFAHGLNEGFDTAAYLVAWRNFFEGLPQVITAVRSSANIKSVQDIKGHKVGYNYGCYNHSQYFATLVKARVTEKDIRPSSSPMARRPRQASMRAKSTRSVARDPGKCRLKKACVHTEHQQQN